MFNFDGKTGEPIVCSLHPHKRSPKTALLQHFLKPFYLAEKLVPEEFYEKDCIVLKNPVKSHLKTFLIYSEFRIHTEKHHFHFNKNSANQTFTFISSKAVYFKKHFRYQV